MATKPDFIKDKKEMPAEIKASKPSKAALALALLRSREAAKKAGKNIKGIKDFNDSQEYKGKG